MRSRTNVRFSRDGDQFHYLWAARRCLRLLSPMSGLVAISIEGTPARETTRGEPIEAGEDQIDVGEYYGSEDVEKARLVRYIQLKHSTQNSTTAWPPSGLEKTIRGFSERYQELENRFGTDALNGRIEFCFISNRPIDSSLIEAVEDGASGVSNRHPNILEKLKDFTSLNSERLSAFCKLLKLEGRHEGYWLQRVDLARETRGYLPGDDVDAPVQLKELVTRKALSESANNPSITKMDVLRVLGATEDRIFPAPSHIAPAENAVPRAQEADLVAKIVSANTPVILHAEGGVGKSVLSQRIKLHLPEDSVAVVYDCFGNGAYRCPGSPRHRHKDALVQIANELAALGICDSLVPSSNADKTDYLRAFAHRVRQSITSIRTQNGQALLCLTIDAADSAESAAKEFGDERSFVRDLLRESLPDGVRLVVLCRTESRDRLDPPATILQLQLKSFSWNETAAFLRKTYSDALDNDVDEFHRLTSHNPRVQATALADSGPLCRILRSLGPNPTTVADTISTLLQQAVDKLHETVGGEERLQIDSICTALATLRPFVPVKVLASVSGVEVAAIRSFASDLGRPLLILEDAIQFRDEPVETWFGEHFKPSDEQLSEFIEKLQPLASESAYVASTLPQLMLEARQLSELVDLALSSSLLPSNPIERRDVELQRLQFALKASLRAKRFGDAAKLALKAAQETAGDTRQQILLHENTDLAAVVMEPDRVQEIVSRRTFGGGWTGSHHAYEAGLLSYIKEFRGDARSRLRMAYEWLMNWSRLSEEERRGEQVGDEDIAEMAMVRFNIDGPKACAAEIRHWRPKEISYRAGRIVARRLVDHGRYDDLDRLAIEAANNLFLLLAINLELRAVHQSPPKETVERALRLLSKKRVKLKASSFDGAAIDLKAITALVETAHIYRLRNDDALASVLQQYLPEEPPRGWTERYSGRRFQLFRAYVLYAGLKGENLRLADLADPELRKRLENEQAYNVSHDLREFKENIEVLLPWHKLWVENFLNPKNPSALATEIAEIHEEATKAERVSFRDESFTSNEIADIWFDILVASSSVNHALLQEFKNWTEHLKRPLYVTTWTKLAHLAARTQNFESYTYELARRAFDLMKDANEDAEYKAQAYVNLARAILGTDESEAREYFNRAIEVVSKIGDEILDRWQAILDLADHAADPSRPDPRTAYELARCAELANKHTHDHFECEGTIAAIAGLCPSSCFTILSRWRDRNFGWAPSLIVTAISCLIEHKCVDSKIVPALMAFRAPWKYGDLLKKTFEAIASHSDRKKMLNHVLHYVRLDEQPSLAWKELEALATANALTISDINQLIEHANYPEVAIAKMNNSHDYGNSYVGPNIDWDAIFLNLDLHTSNGLSSAYVNFKSNRPPFYHEVFFAELFKRIPVGKEGELIRAFSEAGEFDLRHVREFLEQFPEEWKPRMAVRSSLAEAIRSLCNRHCMEITKNRYYQRLPLQLASEFSGMSEPALIGVAVSAIGERTEPLDSKELFTLVGLLASQLSHEKALDALKFGLELFNDVLDEDDGDGPWTNALTPPSDINEAIAGYIWGALAAPQASLRWEAAHVVRGLCMIGGQPILDYLVGFAKRRWGGPFADRRLHFYHLNARQWLLIALARAASENPAILVSHSDFFIRSALHDEPHVVIRHFAAKAALSLAESGVLELDKKIADQLTAMNTSELPVISSKRYDRQHNSRHEDPEKRRFSFDYDISRYWFEDLGNHFAKNVSDIENEAEKVIHDDWHLLENGYWDRDERYRRGFFRDLEARHSHGAYPRTDSLNFYLSYHAMMTVAGKLLASVSLHQDPSYAYDKFEYWLNGHLLSRQDGYWLADRRDPMPLEWPSWKEQKQEDDWRWSVNRSDFDRLLGLGGDRLTLWGYWNTVFGRREETVHISSALVAPDRSAALLAALQTATNPRDYCIPGAGNNLEIDESGFQLKGWVEDQSGYNALDKFDPWAGDIRYPPLKPDPFVCALLELESDKESRVWRLQAEGLSKEVLWSQVWSRVRRRDHEEENERGSRLQASHTFVTEFLDKMNMDLIVEVQIDRDISRDYYERNKDDSLEYVPPYFRLFVLKANGRTCSL